ncbi:putative ribonuclease H-like domain-containing protein [Tanacetum coccineum]
MEKMQYHKLDAEVEYHKLVTYVLCYPRDSKLILNTTTTVQKEDSKALVTIDGEGVDWTNHSEDEDYALMAANSSDSDTELVAHQQGQLWSLKGKRRFKGYPKVEKWHNSSKNLSKLLNTQMSANDKFGLGYEDHRYDGILSYENEVLDFQHRALKNKGIVDSGCSRHMTGNKAYLAEFQDFNGGPVAFGGSKGYITGKGKIKTGELAWFIAKGFKTDESNKWLGGNTVMPELHIKMELLERKEQDLIGLQGPGLQDSFSTYTFWAEEVSTAWILGKRVCYVLLKPAFVLPIWPYASIITPALKSDDMRVGQKRRKKKKSLWKNLERLRDKEMEAYEEAEALRRSLRTCTASPYEGLSLSTDPTNPEEDDSEIPLLEDIYQYSTDDSSLIHLIMMRVQWLTSQTWNLLRIFLRTSALCICLFPVLKHEHKRFQKLLKMKVGLMLCKEGILQYEIIVSLVLSRFAYGMKVYQMDVKSAFLYGKIDEENGYRRGTIDKTLFLKKDKHDIILVQVYVDDIIFGSTKKSWCDEFEALMKSRFQMSSMGELTFFLGLQVKQKEDGIFISQDKYVAEILKKFDFANVKTASTPIETQKPLVKDEEASDVDVHLYRSMIGSLMYLTASRPDIMFAVCACSRFQVTPKSSHLSAVKRIFRYLKGKPKLGLWYPRVSSFDLESYSDSDYAGANLDRKSTTGGCQFLGRRLISWQCKKQTIVATSTTEAEYVAAASCCGQVLWIQNQMLDYGFNFMNTKIYIDNESTICIVKNPVLKIHTDDNVADLLTKAFDVSSTDSAKLVPLGKVCTAIETLKKYTAKALISLLTMITLSTTMVVLDSCPKHNMVAYLEKSEGNVMFHEIIDFLKRSSIHHALTVSPVVSTTFVEQFWTSAKSKIINNVRHITAKVAGKSVSISEASIRSDLLFDDADGIDSLPNQAIFDAI